MCTQLEDIVFVNLYLLYRLLFFVAAPPWLVGKATNNNKRNSEDKLTIAIVCCGFYGLVCEKVICLSLGASLLWKVLLQNSNHSSL